MLIKALRPFRGDEGFVKPHQTLDVNEKRAAELVKRNLATYEVGGQSAAKAQRAPSNKALDGAPSNKAAGDITEAAIRRAGEAPKVGENSEAATAHPTPPAPVEDSEPLSGGRTGAGKQRSSSRAGRRRSK